MPKRKSIMRSLGEFFGHIASAAKTPVSPNERREVRREVQTEQRTTPEGKVTLRRTTIEEIEVEPEE